MSPFITYGPLPPASPLFRGRQRELEKLRHICLGQQQPYATVYGGRQAGKTSLLVRLETTLPSHVLPCRVDFQGAPTASTPQALGFVANRLYECLALPTAPAAQYDTLAFRRYLQEVVKHLGAGQRLLLMFEELGALPPITRYDLANFIRHIFTNRFDYRPLDQLVVVLAGSMELYELATIEVSPLRNICEPLYLGDLGADALNLVVNGLTENGTAQPEAERIAQAIYAQVSGHPYLTQRLAAEVVARFAAGEANPDVEALAAQLAVTDNFFQHLHGALLEHKLLSQTVPLLAGSLRFDRALAKMARLELLGVAVARHGFWAVRNPLLAHALRRWLAQAEAQALAPSSASSAPKYVNIFLNALHPTIGDNAQVTVAPQHAEALRTLQERLHQQGLEQGEMARTLDAVRRALRAMQTQDTQLHAAVQELQTALAGDSSLTHKLEFTLPLIPLLLEYKIELGSEMATLRTELAERWAALQKNAAPHA